MFCGGPMSQLLDTLVQHFRAQGPMALLESQSADHPASSTSYLAAQPKASIKAWNEKIEIKAAKEHRTFRDDPWSALSDFRAQQGDWLCGYLGYDLKNHIEKGYSKNEDPLGAPDLFFMVPKTLIKVDTLTGELTLIKGELPDLQDQCNQPGKLEIKGLRSGMTRSDYISMVKCAKHEIYEGDYYEINLSHQLQAAFEGDPFALYKKMRAVGPVPFGSFLQVDDFSVCSLSPERFLRKMDKTVFSQPIKGTMKRDAKQDTDEKLRQRLIESAKNRAENLMIVDLVRNDLSRIATKGSVQVADLFEIQTFGTVHQMVSTVTAQTDVKNPIQIIKACYPMGSMTGAPKIRVMQSIEKFENYRRGIYSGAIGYLAPNGDFDFNVVIRTAIIKNDLLCYAVGGAITGDSDPADEWDETWLKAKAITESLQASAKRF